jgi:DNA uptake protein ComE-like DNA-binding protein
MIIVLVSKNCHRKALALIVVVYVLAALGTLAFALTFRSRLGLYQAQLLMDKIQHDEIALAACTQACRLLALDDPNVDSREDILSGWHELEMPQESTGGTFEGQVWWRLTDESRKINVNLVSSDVLSRIKRMDQAVVASILDWIDEDDIPNPDGAENEYYASLSPSYRCKNRPFESLEELLFVKGITAEIYFGTRQAESPGALSDMTMEQNHTVEEEGTVGLRELLTVYGDGKINLNTVLPDVLKILPFLSDAAIDEILSRQKLNARKFTSLEDIKTDDTFDTTDKIVLLQVAKFNSNFFRLQIRIQLERTSSIREYTAILERDETEVRVLSWQRKLPRRSDNQNVATDSFETADFVD